jgi:hypothetical protein
MPYRMVVRDGKHCVQVKRDSGWETLKCYAQRSKALAYFAALRINVVNRERR